MKPLFLNVDLRVKSRRGLDAFIEGVKGKATHLAEWKRGGVRFVCFELPLSHRLTCEGQVKAFCRLLEQLPPPAAREWHNAYFREFNAGFESGDENPRYTTVISHETLGRTAALKASLAITLYPLDPGGYPQQ
jgi:hypothetical protein